MRQALSAVSLLAAGAVIGSLGLASLSTSPAFAQQDGQQPPVEQTQPANPAAGMGQMLINSLKSVEGCLGVDAGQMSSGKNVIIGWFEDAEAARRWYRHPTHRAMVMMAGGAAGDGEPLAHVEEGVPLMVIAAITFSDKPEIQGIPMPISQISIEVYRAAPGGAYINGKLAPATFEVEHMRNLTAPAAE
jgi:hypothetical protein